MDEKKILRYGNSYLVAKNYYVSWPSKKDVGDWELFSIWNTDNLSNSIPSTPVGQIKLPLHPDYEYNFTVDWGDGNGYSTTITRWDDPNTHHIYDESGTYEIKIKGKFGGFYFNGGGDRNKILDITQWGGMPLDGCEDAFRRCENLQISAIDTPDLSRVKSMDRMFEGASINPIIQQENLHGYLYNAWVLSNIANTKNEGWRVALDDGEGTDWYELHSIVGSQGAAALKNHHHWSDGFNDARDDFGFNLPGSGYWSAWGNRFEGMFDIHNWEGTLFWGGVDHDEENAYLVDFWSGWDGFGSSWNGGTGMIASEVVVLLDYVETPLD